MKRACRVAYLLIRGKPDVVSLGWSSEDPPRKGGNKSNRLILTGDA